MDIRQYFHHRDADGRPRPESQEEAIERLGMDRVKAMYDYLWKAAERLPLFGVLHAEQIVKDPANFGIYATIVSEIAEQCAEARAREIRLLRKYKYPEKGECELSIFYSSFPRYHLEKDFSRLIKVQSPNK